MNLGQSVRDRQQGVLLALARRGHGRAFRRLYDQLYPAVSRYVSARVGQTGDAEDLVSQVFFKFLRGLDGYDASKGSVWTWVMTMTRHSVIDHYRTRKESESIDELGDVLAAAGPDPLGRLIEDEETRLLHGVLKAYPEDVREMFALRFGQNLRYGEIAQVMGLSEAAVKQRFSRAMRRLREEWVGQPTEGGENEPLALERRSVEDVA